MAMFIVFKTLFLIFIWIKTKNEQLNSIKTSFYLVISFLASQHFQEEETDFFRTWLLVNVQDIILIALCQLLKRKETTHTSWTSHFNVF